MKKIEQNRIIQRLATYALCSIMIMVMISSLEAQPLFTLLESETTGVTFNNVVTDEKEHNILIYSNYYGGAGVGIADFNKDGLQDLFFAGNLVDDQLYYNRGKLEFDEQSKLSGITNNEGWSSGVVIADVNNDSWPDIYVTRELYDKDPEKRKNLLYINTGEFVDSGNGMKVVKFEEKAAEYGVASTERTRHAIFFDYNNDHHLDLFLLNQPPNPGNYSEYSGMKLTRKEWAPRLLRNTGLGTFEDVTEAAKMLLPCYPNSVSASDINKDGFIDLYVSNDYEAPDHLWLNKGDGTFENIIHDSHQHISYYSMGVDIADINNDMKLDIMTLDMVAEDNFRIKSNMSGMNPDAFWDLYNAGGHRQYMYNNLQLNNGNNTFSDIAQMANVASTDWSWSNLIADFDNDGWKDIHITNGLLRDIRNTDAAKTFPIYVKKVINDFIKENPNAGDISIFDILDLDEALELIPSVPLQNFYFKNNGDLTFTKASSEVGADQAGFSNGSAYADLDNDGDLDLVISNINAPAYIYKNNTDKNWLRIKLTDLRNRPIFGSNISIKVGSESQYYEFTNVRGMYSTSENIAHFGVAGSETIDEIKITWPDGHLNVLKDVKANQLLAIDWEQHEPQSKVAKNIPKLINEVPSKLGIDHKHRENGFDDYSKQVLLPHKMSQFGPALAVGDVNNDGLEDVFTGGALGQSGEIYLQAENGLFNVSLQPALKADSLNEDMDALFFDFDSDNDLDLYVVSGGNALPPQHALYQDRLYINNEGVFEKSQKVLPIFRESGSVVKPADFDGDGDLDLFIGGRHNPWDYPSPAVSRLLKNEAGKFVDVTKSNAPGLVHIGLVTDAIWTDVDSDMDLDLMLVGEWMSPQILINDNQKFEFADHNLTDYAGWLYSISAADLDGDGDDDYIIGNLGTNYKYKATSDEPFEVHYGDFDDSGKKDIVLSYYNYGTRFPLRGRSCSSEQVPELKIKFPSYDIFASSNLETVYGEEDLSSALHYEAKDFRSVVILNEGNLKFKIKPLPNAAQISSINSIVVQDLNADNIPDIITSGNLYTSEIETPRNDAGIGLVLLGKGNGEFEALSNEVSGFDNPYDSKKLAIIKTVNGPMLISGNNDSEITVFSVNNFNKDN